MKIYEKCLVGTHRAMAVKSWGFDLSKQWPYSGDSRETFSESPIN